MTNGIDQQIEKFKTDPLEYARQTGRSYNMMEAAKAVCSAGKPVVAIFKDEHSAAQWRVKYQDVPGLTVIPMKRDMSELDWTRLKIVKGPYAHHELFLDHDVIWSYHKELFAAYHKYDRPMDRSPYIEPQQAAA